MWCVLAIGACLAQPANLVVRDGDLSTPVPLLETQRGPMLRLEESLQAIENAYDETSTAHDASSNMAWVMASTSRRRATSATRVRWADARLATKR